MQILVTKCWVIEVATDDYNEAVSIVGAMDNKALDDNDDSGYGTMYDELEENENV